MDDAKYYAFVMTMAEHMPLDTAARRAVRDRALDCLSNAVVVEDRARGRNRDTDAGAATRVRPWP